MRIQSVNDSLDVSRVEFLCVEGLNSSVDNPPAFLAKPRLLLGQLEYQIEDCVPVICRCSKLEKDARFD